MKNTWTINKENTKLASKLSEDLSISENTAQVLINRGIETDREAELFLNCNLFDLPSPFLMKGMDAAVERVIHAINQKEHIAIYGDYDVDGVTATALFHNFLKSLGANVSFYNPDRLKEGYGVNDQAVSKLSDLGVTLVISGDCGITAVEQVKKATEMGIDFIVTDHHKPPDTLPDAVSILNPQQADCKYPGKEIAGVGVIFNLAIALRRKLRDAGYFTDNEPNLGDYLDLVALGTVADCAPLVNVNRIFVKEGLKRASATKHPGLRALKEISSVNGDVDTFDLGFKLGPRINASGRLSSAKNAVELFISRNPERARELATTLNKENSTRQTIEKSILNDAIEIIESTDEILESPFIVAASRDWHPGVIGIVASRVVERFGKPAMLISIDANGVGKGSARSAGNINIYAALLECKELFIEFGGHELAAGISIEESKIDSLRAMLNKVMTDTKYTYVPEIAIDKLIELNDISHDFIEELSMLGPFGVGNPEPVFMARDIEVVSHKLYKDKHIGLKLKAQDRVYDAIWFNIKKPVEITDRADIVFIPELNVWNGTTSIQLRIVDLDCHDHTS